MSTGDGAGQDGDDSPVPGWYPDPGGSGQERYWDGNTWTEHLRLAGGIAQPQMVQAQPQSVVAVPVIAGYQEPKSIGLAIFLDILFPGAGHLYGGVKQDFGVVFLVITIVNSLIAFGVAVIGTLTFGIGCLFLCIPFLIWAGMAIWAAIDVNQKMKEQQFIQAG